MPTDSELNRAMAEALGWRSDGTWNGMGEDTEENWYDPKRERTSPSVKPPDFCHDRNTLPDILDVVGESAKSTAFARLLNEGCGTMEGAAWCALNRTMRDIVEAALRAIGAWRPEFDNEIEK